MTVEGLKTVFDWIAIILIFLTFASGVGVLITGNIINDRQAERLKQFDKDLRDKDLKIAEANRLAADANKATEDERTARVTLEESIAWRRLTQHQKQEIGSKLKRFSKPIVRLVYNVNDVESFNFASDVAVALQLAAWNVDEPQPVLKLMEGPVPLGTSPVLPTGVIVVSTEDTLSHDASEAILRELLTYGFDSHRGEMDKRPNAHVVTLRFEPRPEGPQGDAKLRAQKAKKKP